MGSSSRLPHAACLPIAAFIISLALIPHLTFATGSISAVNSTGNVVDSFSDNDTVYYRAFDLTNGSQLVRVYVVQNYDVWPNGTPLNDVSTGYREVATGPDGAIPMTAIWVKPTPGAYDIIADVNMDGLFNHSLDFIDNVSVTGFSVTETPKASISVIVGSNNPASHYWDFGNDTGFNTIMQFRLVTNQYKAVKVGSIAISAGGTGDDRKDVRVIYLAIDSNGDGIYGEGDTNLGYMAYPRDDGIVNFLIPGGLDIGANDGRNFVLAYEMRNGTLGGTYYADISIVSATDATSAVIAAASGLPLRSAITTISGVPVITSTSTSSTSTSSVWADECASDIDCGGTTCREKKISTYSCKVDLRKGVKVCAANIASVTCCADGDCPLDLYCQNYICTDQAPSGKGATFNYDIIIGAVAILVVMGGAIGAFVLVRNRTRKPWQGKDEVDVIWDKLKEKWKGKESSGQGSPAAENAQPADGGTKPQGDQK
jgi:hypothetical protein